MPDHLNVSVHLRGDTLDGVQALAASENCKPSRAALTLIQRGLAAETVVSGSPAPVMPIAAEASPPIVNLEAASDDELIDELVGRLQRGGDVDAAEDRAAQAEARATTAETRLKAVAAALALQ